MVRSLVLAALLPLLCHLQLHAQSEWQYYTFASAVNSIAEEGDYLWLATDNGLVKFNKNTYAKEIFTPSNSGLPSVYISSVVTDHDGVKWLATRRGLVRFDNTTWQTFDKSTTSLSLSGIRTMFIDRANTLWISTWNEIAHYSNGRWTSDLSTRGMSFSVQAMCETDKNTILLGGRPSDSRSTPLYEVQPGTAFLSERNTGENQPSMNICAAVNHRGNLWLAGDKNTSSSSYATGKVVWNNGKNSRTFLHTDIGFPTHASFTCLSLDSAGHTWVGDAYGQGVARFDGTAWKIFNYTNSLIGEESRVNAILTDRDGIVWIATDRNGLLRYDGTTWRTFATANLSAPNPALPPSVTALATDDKQHIHIGCESGYGVFDGTQMHWYEQAASDVHIRSLAVDPHGTAWIIGSISPDNTPGTPLSRVDIGEQNALCVFTGKNGIVWIGTETGVTACDHMLQTHFSPANSGMLSKCTAIAEAPDGTMWFGTENGIVRYDGKRWTHFTADEFTALRHIIPGTMVCDNSGALWIGNMHEMGYALVKFDGKTWTGYTTLNNSFPLHTVSSLAVDKNGILWLAALPPTAPARPDNREQGGIARFDGTEWRTWSSMDKDSPLSSSVVTSLVVDGNNDLWAGTQIGLLRYRTHAVITSAEESVRDAQLSVFLGQNTPNPASAQTTIQYNIPSILPQQHVQLMLFNTLGEPVVTLVNTYQLPGSYSVEVNASSLSSGVYHYRLQVGNITIGKQMIVVR